MAGYLFSLDSIDSLRLYSESGVYSTRLSPPSGSWRIHHEATLGDYATMSPGDNVYFFIKRRIFGIGEMVAAGLDCKYKNYPSSSIPSVSEYADVRDDLLWDEGVDSVNQRWICTFRPSPHFFRDGIDMDDVLGSRPAAFRILRAFQKLSFIKLDDEENQAFRDILIKRNERLIGAGVEGETIFHTKYHASHERIAEQTGKNDYRLSVLPFLKLVSDSSRLRHEMAIEIGLLEQLVTCEPCTTHIFGEWDYLSHQVIASPFKPIDYMDKMDVFGYRYVPGFKPTRSQYLIVEIKKDSADLNAVEQTMKYVDWVAKEYCFGDYAMIRAFIVAYDYVAGTIAAASQVGTRRYVVGSRPVKSVTWSSLRTIEYAYNKKVQRIEFREVTP